MNRTQQILTVFLVSFRTQKCVVQYTGHHGTLFDIDVQKEKQVLSTAGGDGLIHFYDIER